MQAPAPVRLAAHLGQGVQRVLTDLVAPRAVRPMPRTVDDVDAGYLSELLGRPVTGVTALGGDAGTSSRARLALAGDGVPDTVFVKLPAATAATRLMSELGRLGETEVRFYAHLAPQLTGVPACHGCAFDPWTGRYVLALEDLPAADCEFLDTLHPLKPDQASLLVELLARLHATFWNRVPDWVYSPSGDDTTLLTGRLLRTSARKLADRTPIPLADNDFLSRNYRAVATLTDAGAHTVMHGDAHPGNLYFRNGAAGLLDWQAVRRGHPSRELAYSLITGMTTEDRITYQRELLDEYRRTLAASGGPELDADDLWLRYRQAAQYAYVATTITAGMGGMQDEHIALEGVRRGVAALADLDTVAALAGAMGRAS